MAIHVLGRPRVLCGDAEQTRPRGRKCWALLAYLMLADQPPSRARLAALLYPDADDPLGALRWSLSELRRLLGPGCTVGGDPVMVSLPPTAVVDVQVLQHGHWSQAVRLAGLGGELLEGVDAAGSAAFEVWLATERARLAGSAAAVLHTAAAACLARRDTTVALGHAVRLVELQPLEEAHHVLLIRCLHGAGDLKGAADQADRSARLLRRELGREPSAALREAARARDGTAHGPSISSVPTMLDVAEAAIAGGAVPQGLQTLAEATALARRGPDRLLLARVLLARGRALIDVGRCGDEEGIVLLHEAATVASGIEATVAASAHRELAFANLHRGRYGQVRHEVATARALAAGDDMELSWVETLQGACDTDEGRHGPAFERLASALHRAEKAGAQEASIFAGSFLGRLHVLRGEAGEAATVLDPAVDAARRCWTTLVPWLESLRGEADLLTGATHEAEIRLERAFVMGRQLDDPCSESIATRGLGLVAVACGDLPRGYELLVAAPTMSRRLPDSYLWIEGYALDALCRVAVVHRPADAPGWIAQLERLSARCGMRELLARAMLYRSMIGEPAAFEAAEELASDIDNPLLHAELAGIAA